MKFSVTYMRHLFYRLAGLCVLLFLIFTRLLPAQNIIINEVMSSNSFTIADEDGDYEDWIELHNAGNQSRSLKGWSLTDDSDDLRQWVFPNITLEPYEYLIIWASNKHRVDTAGELHTNFAISADGEELILTNANDELVDQVSPTPLPSDVSFGRHPENLDQWYFFDSPTPAEENHTEGYQNKLEPPAFSLQPGFYRNPQQVELSHPDPDVTIYYTRNGAMPTEHSSNYTGPIAVTDRNGEANHFSTLRTNLIYSGSTKWTEPGEEIQKASVIRAIAAKEGYLNSQLAGGTYIIDQNIHDRYSLPVVSIQSDSSGLFGHEDGIYVPGRFGSEQNVGSGNFSQRGRDWERQATIELFETNGERTLNQEAGIRIHGAFTRRFPQKTLRLYARNDYGFQYFPYSFFPEKKDHHYKRILLRNSGNDWYYTLFMDAAAQSLVRHFNVDSQEYQPVIVFLNGEYWGIHNIRERYDKHYLEREYGADPENIDLLTGKNTAKEGDNHHYNEFIDFVEQHDLSDEKSMDSVKTYADIDNFLDYYSAQIYYSNSDWPQGNIDYWRFRTDYDPHAPEGLDGRWRWLLYDVDRSLGFASEANFDMIKWLLEEVNEVYWDWSNQILLNLLENEQFKFEFINRISDHLNSAFKPDHVFSVLDSLKAPLEPEIDEHIRRWSSPPSVSNWNSNVQQMYIYAENRPVHIRTHLQNHLNTGDTLSIQFDELDPLQGHIQINSLPVLPGTPGIDIDQGTWSGIYFQNIPVTVTAIPESGYKFTHWSGDIDVLTEDQVEQPEITISPDSFITLIPHFKQADPDDTGEPQLLSHWIFTTDLPNNTPLQTIEATNFHDDFKQSELLLTYQPAIFPYPPEAGTGGILDRVNDPTPLNYTPEWNAGISYENSDMRGIRVRNPSLVGDEESSLLFQVPTTGYKDVDFTFATKRTGSGQRELIVEYSTGNEQKWIQYGIDPAFVRLHEIYNQISVSFDQVPASDDNPHFKIRLRFGGDEEIRQGNSGNVRFNNISLEGVDINYTSSEVAEETDIPEEHVLHQNYPNPFNPVTTIQFELAQPEHVQLQVFDLLGRRITTLVDELHSVGIHSVSFDGSSLSSGVYIYMLQTESNTLYRRMTLIK